MEHAGENEQQAQAVSPSSQVTDEALTDQVSDELAVSLESSAGGQELIDPTQEVVLEEEKVKDEIDIQIDLLKDPDWVVRREAAITLGEMGDERCVEPLAAALRDGDWQVREVAIEGIGQIGSPAVDVLLKLLRDWDVRKSAIMALGKIRDERVLDPLMQQLRNDEFMEDATDALVNLGEPALPGLIKALKDKEELVRKQAVIALGRIKSAEAIDPLIEMLQNKDWFTRLTAAAALEAIGDERGREAIKPLLKDSDMVVKMRVERILAKWKKQPAAV
ncbi:MAG TPA: HEAT repeat domain-containing protein [Nitrospira sp.]|nr:HEAT repeat domain-containing protein [Nitrospira sp.]MCC7473160.1 HEAT repeat domain-containing protein [Candidatus Nomurabacteria bacterium]MBS0178847.1 HEAT repeat domain-containing protein [Nitrospira sp.]HNA26290.1 HEAT repeat domain-containing protein [Nitrospira sp.]HNL88421.1 HEAT repeat domain-containing protein [Nitrospira sp.]